jgi:hypothetical protein
MENEYRFTIDGPYTPATIPMDRLADYMGELARLLGESTSVHLGTIESGSTVVVARVNDDAAPKVQDRVARLKSGGAPPDAIKAFHALDELLRNDNATGSLTGHGSGVIIPFPGRNRPEPLVFGPFKQDGTLDGEVVRVGGTDETVHIGLRDGAVIHSGLHTTPDIARKIARYLLGPIIRVHGTGNWCRAGDGSWEIKSFKVVDFEVLSDASLREVVSKLREVKGSVWGEVPDAIQSLLSERHDDGDPH